MYFAAFGEWPTADPVTAIVGREPTNFRVKGERVGKSAIVRKQSIWEIDSGLPEQAGLEEHLESLLAILESMNRAYGRWHPQARREFNVRRTGTQVSRASTYRPS